MTHTPATPSRGPARLAAAGPLAVLAGLAISGGVVAAALSARPVVAALTVGAAAVIAAMVALARRFGAAALWVSAALVAIMAGEMSSVSLAGQSGRLLWADEVVALGACLACMRHSFVIEVPRAPLLDRLWPFLGWCAISLIVAGDPLTAAAELKEWVVTAVLAVGAVTAATDARRARLLLGVVAGTGVVVAAAMLGVAATSPMGAPLAITRKLVDLPWGRTNYLAGLLVLAIPLLLGLMGEAASGRVRLACVTGLLVTMGGLVVSASKGAMVSLALALALSFGLARRQSRAPRLIVLLMFAAAAALCIATPLRQVLEMRLQESALDYSVSERLDLYRVAWEQFLRHPVCGIGLNVFSVVAHRLHGVDTVPHNFELGFMAELGLPGALLALMWAWGLGAGARRARRWAVTPRERSLAVGLWGAFLTFAFHNQVESTLYGQQYKMLLVVYAAAAWAIGREWQARGAGRARGSVGTAGP